LFLSTTLLLVFLLPLQAPDGKAQAKATPAKAARAAVADSFGKPAMAEVPPLAVKSEPPDQPAKALPAIGEQKAKDMHYQLKALAKNGKPELWDKYKSCITRDDKRKFYWEDFLFDPDVSKKSVHQSRSKELVQSQAREKGWFTSDQIATYKGIMHHVDNYKELLQACTKGLPERAHEDAELARLKVMQYQYTHYQPVTETENKRKQLTLEEQVSDLNEEDWGQVNNAIGSSDGVPGKKMRMSGGSSGSGPPSTPPPGQEPEEPAWFTSYKVCLQKANNLCSTVGNNIAKAGQWQHKLELMSGKAPAKENLRAAYHSELVNLLPQVVLKKESTLKTLCTFPSNPTKNEKECQEHEQSLKVLHANLEKHMEAFKKATKSIKDWVENNCP
jgi:hypothetical protein